MSTTNDLIFTKMHGIGNDYLFSITEQLPENPGKLARSLSRRHFSVGSDGLIFITPSTKADYQMHMFNADGSEAEMCGNGLRCIAKYVYDRQLVQKQTMTIETKAGIIPARIVNSAPRMSLVQVTLPEPNFEPTQIPVRSMTPLIEFPINLTGELEFNHSITAVSVGNPHCVLFYDQKIEALPVAQIGSVLEQHHLFPNRTNVEFVQIINPQKIKVRVWERGSGETLACGSGACAAVSAGVATHKLEKHCTALLNGGPLTIEWQKNVGLHLTGPAVEVFSGSIPYQFLRDEINGS